MVDTTPFTSPDGEPSTQGVDEKNVENDENEQPNINELEEAAAHKILHELNGNNGNKKSALSDCPLRFAEHKAFLRLVHSAPGGGDELYLGRALPGAIERYVNFWLPLVAREAQGSESQGGCCAPLIPPFDIAWVWHLHRLAPLRYAAYCTERFGRVLDPGMAAFRAQTAADADDETRRLWRQHFGVEPFFQPEGGEGVRSVPRAAWGPRDPLSRQTTLSPEIKEMCAKVRSALTFDYDAETCSARQRTFLWQVSQPACSEGGAAAITARYVQFLGLMREHGYADHFFVPSYDIDFAWHTHMLSSTSAYLRESAALAGAPGGVDHDDSVNQRQLHSQLHRGWQDTKELWALSHGETAPPIDLAGVTYRGEPPDWWFHSDPSAIFRVRDGFLSEAEVEAALESLRHEANVRRRAHSGLDMVCEVSADVMRRIREQLDGAEGAVLANRAMDREGDGPAQVEAEQQGEKKKKEEEHEEALVGVPARVCPAAKSVPQHKDKADGYGACVSSWICVVYLTRQPGSALVLVDDVSGIESRVAIEPGRLCCWPNARFSHRVDVDATAAAAAAVAAQGGALGSFRCMLGPMAFGQTTPNSKEIVYTEGGCGGGGCGGGGCGGGGCGGGGCAGGGGEPPIKNTATKRIVGLSTLSTIMKLPQGTASQDELHRSFAPSAYNAEHSGLFQKKTVPYMNEGAISPAYWQQLQQQLQQLEATLAQIANQSAPLDVCDPCCGGYIVPGARAKIDAIRAVATFIKATRDVYMASVNLTLDSLPCPPTSGNAQLNVRLAFGGLNSAYYLDAVRRRAGYSAAWALQTAQTEELLAREALSKFGIVASAAAVAPGDQLMAVQVPDGLTGGQSLQVQTPTGLMAVQIPPGLTAGQSFQIQLPMAPPVAQPVMARK